MIKKWLSKPSKIGLKYGILWYSVGLLSTKWHDSWWFLRIHPEVCVINIHDDFWGFINMSDEQPKEVAPVVQLPPPRLLRAAWAKATATPPTRARSVAEADALLRHFAFDPVRHRGYASMHPGALNPFAKEWDFMGWGGRRGPYEGTLGSMWRGHVSLKKSWKSTIFNEK